MLKDIGDNESSKFVCPYLDDEGVVRESLTIQVLSQCQCRCRTSRSRRDRKKHYEW